MRSTAARALLVGGFALLLSLPLLSNLTHYDPGPPLAELRVPAAWPEWPRTWQAAQSFPTALAATIDDRYGLRSDLIRLDGELRYRLFGEFASDQVVLGRHGRLFFDSHAAGAPFSLMERICGTEVDDAQTIAAARGLGALLDLARTIAPRAYYVSVPTSPVIDAGDLPSWLARRCAAGPPFVERLATALAAVRPDVADGLLYPRQTLAQTSGAYPPWNFHWSGAGARAVMEEIGDRILALPRRVTLPDRMVERPSDLAQFTPGVDHTDVVPTPDYAAAHIAYCEGGGCDAAFTPFLDTINEISEARWQAGHGPSLLIISDSFGTQPAQYAGVYFSDMLHLNIAFDRLRPGELSQLASAIAARGPPDVLLIVFHDAAAIDAPGLAGPLGQIAAAFR